MPTIAVRFLLVLAPVPPGVGLPGLNGARPLLVPVPPDAIDGIPKLGRLFGTGGGFAGVLGRVFATGFGRGGLGVTGTIGCDCPNDVAGIGGANECGVILDPPPDGPTPGVMGRGRMEGLTARDCPRVGVSDAGATEPGMSWEPM